MRLLSFSSPASRLIALLSLLGLSSSLATAGEPNTLTVPEAKAGWKLIFDGKTTQGWRNFKKDGISDGWKVEDGALVRAGDKAGDIITDKQYDNFELTLEFKISEGGNSGIMFHVTEAENSPPRTGPEVQINDHHHGKDPQQCGWLYQLYQPGNDRGTGKPLDAFRGHDQWNEVYLRVTKQQCEINLNGVRYATFQIGNKDWNDRVAKSKFATWENFGKAGKGHICLQDHGNVVAFRNIRVRELPANGEVPNPVDGVLPLQPVAAYPDIQWEGWTPVSEEGRANPMRPIVLTHANDQSGRVFVATQDGMIYVLENKPDVKEARIFLNLRNKVKQEGRHNEEGLLGLAFHPRFKETGEFFAYYTHQREQHLSVVSRFRVSKDNPNKADPAYEEEVLVIDQPFGNHNGGTVCFGPDGYLYVGLGDGGAANDPFGHGQNLSTLLGAILRIDIDHKDQGLNYAIPKDNPFVNTPGARGEIYAYGIRNVWRIAFDQKTGDLWAGEVGQNLWEEVLLIKKGGNYGWNLVEGTHPFGSKSADGRNDLIPPVWEYDHQVGKSITGGTVYRGKTLPELVGKYVYADYVTGRIWALDYDIQSQTVRANLDIPTQKMPVLSFGEDAENELYFLIETLNAGRGVYKFTKQ